MRAFQQGGAVGGAEHVEVGEAAARIAQGGVEQVAEVREQLVDERLGEHVGLVFGLHDGGAVGLEHDGQRQRHLRARGAELELGGAHAVDGEAVGALAHGEAEAHQLVHAVAACHAVRIRLADNAIDADAAPGERAGAGLAHGGDQAGEVFAPAERGAQQQGVAEVADELFGARGAVGDRDGDQEVVGGGVAVHERVEAGQQHHERRGGVLARELLGAGDQFGREAVGAALGVPAGARRCRAGQFQRLGKRPQGIAPIGDIGFGGFGGGGDRGELHGVTGAVGMRGGNRPGARRLVGGVQLGEEHGPGVVVPADVVDGEQHHVLVGTGADQRGPQRELGAQGERTVEIAAGQHLDAQVAAGFGEVGEVVGGPCGARVGGEHLERFALGIGAVGGAQDVVAGDDGVERGVQAVGVERTGEPVGDADVEGGVVGVAGLQEPHAALAGGEGAPLPRGDARDIGRDRRRGGHAAGAQLLLEQLLAALGDGQGGFGV